MAGGIAGCLLLGILFLYLAIRQHRRSARWHGAVRLSATVEAVRYQEARERKSEINDHKSSTEATLHFTDRGRAYEKCLSFPGIIQAPVPGQTLPIFFDRETGDWIPRNKVHTHWRLFLALGCLCLAAGLALSLDGRGILSDLADYHVQAPNPAGSAVCALIGLTCGCCAYACVRGLLPDLLRTTADPFLWIIKYYLLDRYEKTDALCVGIIRRESGDDDVSYYPLFQYSSGGKQLYWFPKRQTSRKRYQPGSRYTLYRDLETDRCALKPTVLGLVCAPLSLIPIGFFLMLILSLAVCATGTLYLAGMGFVSIPAV